MPGKSVVVIPNPPVLRTTLPMSSPQSTANRPSQLWYGHSHSGGQPQSNESELLTATLVGVSLQTPHGVPSQQQPEPMMAAIERQLDEHYQVHRLARAADPEALLADVAPRVRAIVTGGATVILAMSAGRRAARAIATYLQMKPRRWPVTRDDLATTTPPTPLTAAAGELA